MQSRVLGWPRSVKRLVVLALDVVLALLATWIAFTLRLDTLHRPTGAEWWVYGLAPALSVPIFIRFGLYRAIFRYTGQAAFLATSKAIGIYAGLLLTVLVLRRWPGVPRSLGVLQPLIFLLLVGASRAAARFWLAHLAAPGHKAECRILIYGAGTAGVQVASALGVSDEFILLGFVDDDPSKVGRSINGTTVLHPSEVPGVVSTRAVTDILLAVPNASREQRTKIFDSLHGLPVHIRTLPGFADLASGRVKVEDFRNLEVEDLLGRDPVPPDVQLLSRDLTDQVVLVSGAGGSIGGELTRQIVLQRPRQLVLLDHNEFGLYSIHQELQGLCAAQGLSVELVPVLGSVVNYARLQSVFSNYRPSTVYHAAAYKHVPMVEHNPAEGVGNNVFGTLNMARAASESGVKRFLLVSTDKAVRPTNVMGATKRMAELVLQALAANGSKTCFTMVRFGNVLDSSGSVVPLFRKQLAAGGPITLTHAEVTRYFMTIPEAAQLVLQAGAMASGGEVFVLDMGEPVKIIDLARRMVQLSGLSVRDDDSPGGSIEIAITGLRPGEKLYEELLIGENAEPTEHPRILKAHEAHLTWPILEQHLLTLRHATDHSDEVAIKAVLQACVLGYGTSFVAPSLPPRLAHPKPATEAIHCEPCPQ